MFRKNAFRLLILVVLVISLTGCAGATTPVSENTKEPHPIESAASAPSTPITTKMVLSDLPEINEPVDLIFTASVNQWDAPNTKAVVTLPEDAVLIDGELEWGFDLLADESKTFTLTIMFTTLGNKMIEGYARCEKETDIVWGDSAAVFFHITENGSFEGWPPNGKCTRGSC